MQDARIERVFFGKGIARDERLYFSGKTFYAVLRRNVQMARLGVIFADFHKMHVIVFAGGKSDEKQKITTNPAARGQCQMQQGVWSSL